jgi:hypothetical protein
MSAFNFNVYANALNTSIAVLANGKKLYDAGVFANVYVGKPGEKKHRTYFGILLKYTALSYSRDTTRSGGIVSFSKEKGTQLATIFTVGTSYAFRSNIVIRSLFGLGGFNLHGDYREEYNAILNQNSKTTQSYHFLPKIYLGLNAGFLF